MAARAELIGVRLRGRPPLGTAEFPIEAGFTALAGRNGAGKTTLLNALAEALSGQLHEVDQAHLLFRVGDGPEAVAAPSAGYLAAALSRLAPGRRRREQPLDRTASASDQDRPIGDLLRTHLQMRLEGRDQLYIDEVLGADRSPNPVRAYLVDRAEAMRLQHGPLVQELLAQSTMAIVLNRGRRPELWVAASHSNGSPPSIAEIFKDAEDIWDMAVETAQESIGDGFEPYAEFSDDPFFEAYSIEEGTDWSFPFVGAELPIPMIKIGTMTESWPIPVYFGGFDADPDRLMTAALLGRCTSNEDLLALTLEDLGDFVADCDPEADWEGSEPLFLPPVRPDVQRALDRASGNATNTWRTLRPDDATDLRCALLPFPTWVSGTAVQWQAFDSVTSRWVPLEALSDGQRRWALLSAEMNSLPEPDTEERQELQERVGWFVIDEPERALHRTAANQLAEALARIAEQRPMNVLTATHGDGIFWAARHRRVVERSESGIKIQPEPDDPRELAEVLGIPITDVLGRYRIVLIVEGAHDEIVLNGLLGNQLRELKVCVIPAHGGSQMPSILESKIMFPLTDAQLVVLLDDSRCDEVRAAWARATNIFERGEGLDAVLASLKSDMPGGRRSENLYLRDCMTAALTSGHASRFHALGLPEPDILCYLDLGRLFPGQHVGTWQQEHRKWQKERGSNSKPGKWPDKKWLSHKYGQPIEQHLAEAVSDMAKTAPLPPDFEDLISSLARLSADTSATG